jgi:hypothetical protein
MTEIEAREKRVRSLAERQGYELQKSPLTGRYCLSGGGNIIGAGFLLSLELAEAWLRQTDVPVGGSA